MMATYAEPYTSAMCLQLAKTTNWVRNHHFCSGILFLYVPAQSIIQYLGDQHSVFYPKYKGNRCFYGAGREHALHRPT